MSFKGPFLGAIPCNNPTRVGAVKIFDGMCRRGEVMQLAPPIAERAMSTPRQCTYRSWLRCTNTARIHTHSYMHSMSPSFRAETTTFTTPSQKAVRSKSVEVLLILLLHFLFIHIFLFLALIRRRLLGLLACLRGPCCWSYLLGVLHLLLNRLHLDAIVLFLFFVLVWRSRSFRFVFIFDAFLEYARQRSPPLRRACTLRCCCNVCGCTLRHRRSVGSRGGDRLWHCSELRLGLAGREFLGRLGLTLRLRIRTNLWPHRCAPVQAIALGPSPQLDDKRAPHARLQGRPAVIFVGDIHQGVATIEWIVRLDDIAML
mmetsp:Transcript_65851/g.186110  ORF Transcript_65851/g.186110 Transcript_65851/m.186110 type:complete len:315 (+) Transcript_65851:219-1163(+)